MTGKACSFLLEKGLINNVTIFGSQNLAWLRMHKNEREGEAKKNNGKFIHSHMLTGVSSKN